MRTVGVVAALIASFTFGAGSSVSAMSQASPTSPAIVADLDGQPVKSALISRFYCHDFDSPNVHCFRSASALERAVRRLAEDRVTRQSGSATTVSGGGLAGPTAGTLASVLGDYVLVYDGTYYSGAYMYISQNYDTLWSISWNDRISSFNGRNGASGAARTLRSTSAHVSSLVMAR